MVAVEGLRHRLLNAILRGEGYQHVEPGYGLKQRPLRPDRKGECNRDNRFAEPAQPVECPERHHVCQNKIERASKISENGRMPIPGISFAFGPI